jgi:hypothetical protein
MRNSIRCILAAALALFATFGAGSAAAQNLVTNGSFEAGFASWTLGVDPNCTFETLAAGVPTAGFGAFVTPAPAQGALVAMTDANNVAVCEVFQDVALPAGASYTLTLAAGYNFADATGLGTVGCSVSVDVTTTGGVPIANVYTMGGAVDDPMAARAPVNLSAQAGTTVRIIATATSCVGGPVGMELDNVVLLAGPAGAVAIPTLGEWALILLALTMAGLAATGLRRKS